MPSSIPNIDSLEGLGTDGSDEYSTLKKLQRHLEYVCWKWFNTRASGLQILGTFNFRKNTSRMSNGTNRVTKNCFKDADALQESEERVGTSTGRNQTHSKRSSCHRTIYGGHRSKVGDRVFTHFIVITNSFLKSTGIVQSSTGSNYVVRILSTLDREKLKPSSSVALHRHSNALVDILPPEADSSIAMLGAHEKPDVTYADVGGLDMQKQEIREAVELPLTHFDLYKQIGCSTRAFCLNT